MRGELLLKARIYPISLVGIANRYEPRLEFSRENYNTWKVEIAVGALSSLLDELWKTQKALLMYDQKLSQRFRETGHDPHLIRATWQALVPLALAVHLHGDFPSPEERVGVDLAGLFREKLKSAIEAVKSLRVSSAQASAAINGFLSLFREWAESVAKDPRQMKDYNAILNEVNSRLGDIFPPEEVRRHIAAFVSDLLRLVSVTEEEIGTSFQDPINNFFSQVKGPYVSYLQRDVWFTMPPFDSIKDEDVKEFAFEFFPWILIVRYYLNKVTGNAQGSLWRELMEDPNKTLGAGAWGSNLPALLWGSLYPSDRKEKSPNDEKFAKEAISFPSAIAPRISGATTTGISKLTNLSLATAVASDISTLTTGLPLATAEIHRRNYPGQLRGVVECLKDVLNFVLNSLEESQDPVDTLTEIIENPGNPKLSSFLKSLLGITSLDSVDQGQVNKFKQILQEKIRRLEALERNYSQQQDLLRQAWAFISEFGKIIGREVQFHEDVDEMIKDIFRMVVEVAANYHGSEWRRALWTLSSRAYRYFGSYMAMSYGAPTNTFEATGSLEGAEGSRAAVLRFVDTVIGTATSPPQEDKELFKRFVKAIKELHRVLDSAEVVIGKRAVLGISSSRWDKELKEQLKELKEQLEEIGLSLEKIVESDKVEDLYEQVKGFISREKLKEIFSWFREVVEKAWVDFADKAAERVSQVVKGLSLTTMPSGKLAEWLGTLFRAARVGRIGEVPIQEGPPPGTSKEEWEGREGAVTLAAPTTSTMATDEEVEDFLYRVLVEFSSVYRGVKSIAPLLEKFAEAWDKYVAEVGRSEITIDSLEFGKMVGRVLEELLGEGKVHEGFVKDFVTWLYKVKGCSIVGLEGLPKLQNIVKEVLGGGIEEEVGVEGSFEGVGERPKPPFGPEESTSTSPDGGEEEDSSGSPDGSSEPRESEEGEGRRHLILKFVFLAKALRVFP
jgi:hypothetical protein